MEKKETSKNWTIDFGAKKGKRETAKSFLENAKQHIVKGNKETPKNLSEKVDFYSFKESTPI